MFGGPYIRHVFSFLLLVFCSHFLLAPTPASAQPPVISSGGIVNSANYTAAIAPGSLIAIYGRYLAPATAVAQTLPLPTQLQAVYVDVVQGGRTYAAPLVFVSAGQINAQVPYEVSGTGATIRVRTPVGTSAPEGFTALPRAPQLYTRTMDGRGEAIAMHADFKFISTDAPARPKETIVMYVTGLGEVNPAIPAGRAAGDGGALGPLNRVTTTVTVTVNGRAAQVPFAGLAPYFAGVYQLNVTLPDVLADGPNSIMVSAGGQNSQAGVTVACTSRAEASLKPEEVLEVALQAQARGDVQSMLAHFTTDLHSARAAEVSRAVFDLIRSRVSFREFRFRHRATSYSTDGEAAFVRAEASYILTAGGVDRPTTVGLLAYLEKRGDVWKVVNVHPDDALNQEIYHRTLPKSSQSGLRLAGQPDLTELNERADHVMNTRTFNKLKAGADYSISMIGTVTGIGDAVAYVYQGLNTIWDAKELVKEYWTYGRSPIFSLRFHQVCAGIMQIAAETTPGLDQATDLYAGALDQITYHEEVKRAVYQIKASLVSGEARFNPRFKGPLLNWDLPIGFDFELDQIGDYTYGRPLNKIILKKPFLGLRVPFLIAGELAIPYGSELADAAKFLGAINRDGHYWIPFDLTSTVESGEPPDGTKEDPIFQNMKVEQSLPGNGPVASWEVTCNRGIQRLYARLYNGEYALGPFVESRAMNSVSSLELQHPNGQRVPPGGKITVMLGSTLSGFSILGVIPGSESVDLTSATCVDSSVSDYAVALDDRRQGLAIDGVAKGTTQLNLTLPGSIPANGVAPVQAVFTLEVVEDRLAAWLKSINWGMAVVLNGDGLCTYRGTPTPAHCGLVIYMNNTHYTTDRVLHAASWEGRKFTVEGVHDEIPGRAPVSYRISGTVSADGSTMQNVTLSYTSSELGMPGTVYSTSVSFTNLPRQGKNPAPPINLDGSYQDRQTYWFLKGPGIQSLITAISQTWTENGEIYRQLVSQTFDADSILSVSFWEEH